MPIIEDFYLLAHDERGKPRLHTRATAIGLAAGVLAELMLTGHVTFADRHVIPTVSAVDGGGRARQYAPPPDPLGHTIYDQICHEPRRHHVRTWLSVLAPTITEAVALRLDRIGVLHAVVVGRIRRTTRYQPIDPDAGTKVKVVLASRLTRHDPSIGWSDAVLAGLLAATGLIAEVLWQDTSGTGHYYLGQLMQRITQQMPAFADLFADTEAAIGDAVLTHRN